MTLNDLERHNGHVVCVISPNSVAFAAYYVKVIKIHRNILRVKCSPNNLVLVVYHLWRYSQGITPSEGVKVKRPPVTSENLTYTVSQKTCRRIFAITSSNEWLIVTDILSRTVSELSQLTVQILDTAFLALFGLLRYNVRYSSWAHWKAVDFLLVLIEKKARCYGWGATDENRSKIGDKRGQFDQSGQFDPKF